MLIVLQPELAERVVFAAVRRDGPTTTAYQSEFARCHQVSDAEGRDAAFRRLHERWFEQLGLLRAISDLVQEFRFLSARADRLVVREAAGRATQSVELFGAPGRYTVGMTVAVATFLDSAALRYFARHEFMHIDDMLDPAFGYDDALRPRAATRAAENLWRDRFAVLWAISCDARIAASGGLPESVLPRRRAEFARAFRPADDPRGVAEFDALWNAWQRSRPTHCDLIEAAEHRRDEANDAGWRAPANLPGSACPVCHFSTFEWADISRLCTLAPAVSRDFPTWTPDDGLCGRCADLYASRRCDNPRVAAGACR